MNKDSDLSVEKMKINDRLTAVEILNTQMLVKLDLLVDTNKNALNLLTGNGNPEKGLVFRMAQIESKEKGKEQNSTALWTFLSSLGVLVIGDWIHRTFFHK